MILDRVEFKCTARIGSSQVDSPTSLLPDLFALKKKQKNKVGISVFCVCFLQASSGREMQESHSTLLANMVFEMLIIES